MCGPADIIVAFTAVTRRGATRNWGWKWLFQTSNRGNLVDAASSSSPDRAVKQRIKSGTDIVLGPRVKPARRSVFSHLVAWKVDGTRGGHVPRPTRLFFVEQSDFYRLSRGLDRLVRVLHFRCISTETTKLYFAGRFEDLSSGSRTKADMQAMSRTP